MQRPQRLCTLICMLICICIYSYMCSYMHNRSTNRQKSCRNNCLLESFHLLGPKSVFVIDSYRNILNIIYRHLMWCRIRRHCRPGSWKDNTNNDAFNKKKKEKVICLSKITSCTHLFQYDLFKSVSLRQTSRSILIPNAQHTNHLSHARGCYAVGWECVVV